MNKKKNNHKRLQIIVANPPNKEQADKLIDHVSEIIKLKYYS